MIYVEHRYVYTGEDDDPPEDVTHVTINESITVIPEALFFARRQFVELKCHDGVIKIEGEAFGNCPRLERLIMNGVEEVEREAFSWCEAAEHVECKKLEIIGAFAFYACTSMKSIDLPSAKVVEMGAFDDCIVLSDVKFGKKLESIGEKAFKNTALKRITVPLKSGLFTTDDVFVECKRLDEVCLIEEASIHETVDALLLDEWKKDMNNEIDSIFQILPNANAGEYGTDNLNEGGKTRAIRDWIGRVLRKIIHYKVEHYRLLSLAAAALAHASPNEIVIDSALSFLQLPDHLFEGEGDSSATTPALDRQLWEDVVQLKQRRVEMENVARLEQKILEQDRKIAALNALNDEKEDEIHQLKLRVAQLELQNTVSESGGVIMKNDADRLTKKRPRGHNALVNHPFGQSLT